MIGNACGCRMTPDDDILEHGLLFSFRAEFLFNLRSENRIRIISPCTVGYAGERDYPYKTSGTQQA